MKSILENGWMRMSEFGNLIDKNELYYGSRIFENDGLFNLEHDAIENLKNNIFCLSACESNEETKRDTFMWEVYGDKGKGVYIEYAFTCKDPYFHIFGEVQYGLTKLEPLKKLKFLSDKFKKENDGFFPREFLRLILEIQAYHKAMRYSSEKEIRVLFKSNKNKYEEHNHSSIYKDLNSNQQIKYFSKIYLKDLNNKIKEIGEDGMLKHYPQIEIKKIVLGYNISIENKIDLMDFINKIKEKKDNKYDFEIHQITEELDIVKMV